MPHPLALVVMAVKGNPPASTPAVMAMTVNVNPSPVFVALAVKVNTSSLALVITYLITRSCAAVSFSPSWDFTCTVGRENSQYSLSFSADFWNTQSIPAPDTHFYLAAQLVLNNLHTTIRGPVGDVLRTRDLAL